MSSRSSLARRVPVRGRQGAAPIEQHGGSDVGRQLVEIAQRQLGRERGICHRSHNTRVTLPRLSWLITVIICVLLALLLLVKGYTGYFGVLLAVAASAAINLR